MINLLGVSDMLTDCFKVCLKCFVNIIYYSPPLHMPMSHMSTERLKIKLLSFNLILNVVKVKEIMQIRYYLHIGAKAQNKITTP